MSFLKAQPASTGLGNLIGVDPSRISQIANSVGTVANGIAQAGGATAGYDGSAAPVNHLQLLDPAFIRTVMAKFGPAGQFGNVDFSRVPSGRVYQ